MAPVEDEMHGAEARAGPSLRLRCQRRIADDPEPVEIAQGPDSDRPDQLIFILSDFDDDVITRLPEYRTVYVRLPFFCFAIVIVALPFLTFTVLIRLPLA